MYSKLLEMAEKVLPKVYDEREKFFTDFFTKDHIKYIDIFQKIVLKPEANKVLINRVLRDGKLIVRELKDSFISEAINGSNDIKIKCLLLLKKFVDLLLLKKLSRSIASYQPNLEVDRHCYYKITFPLNCPEKIVLIFCGDDLTCCTVNHGHDKGRKQ